MDSIFAEDFREEPYWWREAPRVETTLIDLPATADVLVVGSGILGLNVAIPLARAGRKVVLVEASVLGHGASTRLAGFIGRSLLHSLPVLIKRYGRGAALSMFAEAGEAHFFLLDWLNRENMDVGMLYRGRLTAAHTPKAYEDLARGAEAVGKLVPLKYSMCPASEQHKEIGSDFYHGGMVWEEHGTLHPGLYHTALVARARASEVMIVDGTPVILVAPDGTGFRVVTSRGDILAREVVIATNGHTRDERQAAPWVRERVIPAQGYQIVTEPISDSLMQSLKPTGRAMHDTKKNIYWDRPTPDDRRLLFGARTGTNQPSVPIAAKRLHRLMARVYPQLTNVKLSNAWQGTMGFTFDRIPHIGRTPEGAWYGLICNAQGLPLGTYLGQRLAAQILGIEKNASIFWNRELPTWPFYRGDPWFLPAVTASYDLQDHEGAFASLKGFA